MFFGGEINFCRHCPFLIAVKRVPRDSRSKSGLVGTTWQYFRSKLGSLPRFFETNGPVGGRGSQAGYEIKSIVLHFNLVFSLDQHQPSMIFFQSTHEYNLGSPGPGLAFENADIT